MPTRSQLRILTSEDVKQKVTCLRKRGYNVLVGVVKVVYISFSFQLTLSPPMPHWMRNMFVYVKDMAELILEHPDEIEYYWKNGRGS
jgi:hypothetical protein